MSLDSAPSVRLSALAKLLPGEIELLASRVREARSASSRTELRVAEFGHRVLLVSGWAARARHFPDGRRQLLRLLLPGDVVHLADPAAGSAVSSVVALTDVVVAAAPPMTAPGVGLDQAYSRSRAVDSILLHRQIARLGRLDAFERLADFLLELRDRLTLAGQASALGFPLPITQEMIGDALGLTSVHVNRMFKLLRQDGAAEVGSNYVRLLKPERLELRVDWQPISLADQDVAR